MHFIQKDQTTEINKRIVSSPALQKLRENRFSSLIQFIAECKWDVDQWISTVLFGKLLPCGLVFEGWVFGCCFFFFPLQALLLRHRAVNSNRIYFPGHKWQWVYFPFKLLNALSRREVLVSAFCQLNILNKDV